MLCENYQSALKKRAHRQESYFKTFAAVLGRLDSNIFLAGFQGLQGGLKRIFSLLKHLLHAQITEQNNSVKTDDGVAES